MNNFDIQQAAQTLQQASQIGQSVNTQRQPEVQEAVDRLERICAAMNQMAHILADKLSPVLRPEGLEASNKTPGQIKPVGTPLADRIEALCDQIELAKERIAGVVHRVEV